jgi:peptidoglycan/LPS O-acetylase OafA/YrhL
MRAKLVSLEAGRGIAALLVVLFHCWHHCRAAYGDFWLGRLFAFGHAGVDFFFVLSGFIILYAHRRDIDDPSALPGYIQRRVTRIYPLYWVLLFVTVVGVYASHRNLPSGDWLVMSGLLLPTRNFTIMADSWTLQHEMIFYAIFALLLFSKRVGTLALGLWLTALIMAAVHGDPVQSGLSLRLTSMFDFEFFLGMAAVLGSERLTIAKPRLVLLGGVLSFLAVGTAENLGLATNNDLMTHAAYGLASSIAICGLVLSERQGLRVPGLLLKLGDSSYALYLIHVLAIGMGWQVLRHSGGASLLPAWIVYCLLVFGAVAAGLLTRTWIERPLTKLTRWLVSSAPHAVTSLRASVPLSLIG